MAKVIVIGGFAESLLNFRGPLLQAMGERGNGVVGCAPNGSPAVRRGLAEIKIQYRDVYLHRSSLNVWRDLKTVLSLIKVMREVRPDIVLSYTIKPVIYGTLAAFWCGVPNIFAMITGLGYAFGCQKTRQRMIGALAGVLYKLAARRNHKLFFQNPDDRNYFIQKRIIPRAQKAIVLNGSGVDLKRFAPTPFPRTVNFLMIARFLREKGIYEFVEAARQLRKRHPKVRFSLVGWIDEGPSAISAADLQGWVKEGALKYLGKMRDVRPAISDCSVYVLPSYREGTPRTVLEAMAMGRPIITTDAPGCRETVIEGRNGFLVPVKDGRALVAAMEKMILSPRLIERMGKEGRRIAVEKYDVDKVNQVILREMGL